MTFKIYRNGKLYAELINYAAFCKMLDAIWLDVDDDAEFSCDVSDGSWSDDDAKDEATMA